MDACLRGDDALDFLLNTEYDTGVLDIALPGMNGLDMLRWLRAKNNKTSVLLLTVRDSVSDRVAGRAFVHGAPRCPPQKPRP